MSVQENKTIARRFVGEVFNKDNLDAIEDYIAPDFIDHNPPPGASPDLQGIKEAVTAFRAAFPDMQILIEDEIGEEDKVVLRTTIYGTQEGDFLGIAPTGKCTAISSIDILRIADGKIVEHWGISDQLTLLQQLGVISSSAEAA